MLQVAVNNFAIRIAGFDHLTACLIFVLDARELNRNYADISRLNKAANKLLVDRVQSPTESYRKLSSELSWRRDLEGWKPHFIRSVMLVEKWINHLYTNCRELVMAFLNEEIHETRLEEFRLRRATEARPRMLQQYFACDSNINDLLTLASDSLPINGDDVCFLEPSCGDGRILKALMKRGARNVVGCDIDHVVAAAAQQLVDTELQPGQAASVHVGDFLTTCRETLLSPACTGRELVVVGGPPYSITAPHDLAELSSSSGGASASGSETEPAVSKVSSAVDYVGASRDDYPLLFMRHAAELEACRVVFILPDRCGQPSFIERAAEALNQQGRRRGGSGEWRMTACQPGDSSFDLLGRVIKQPAVIQRWDRS
jgi:hypothetical protein